MTQPQAKADTVGLAQDGLQKEVEKQLTALVDNFRVLIASSAVSLYSEKEKNEREEDERFPKDQVRFFLFFVFWLFVFSFSFFNFFFSFFSVFSPTPKRSVEADKCDLRIAIATQNLVAFFFFFLLSLPPFSKKQKISAGEKVFALAHDMDKTGMVNDLPQRAAQLHARRIALAQKKKVGLVWVGSFRGQSLNASFLFF